MSILMKTSTVTKRQRRQNSSNPDYDAKKAGKDYVNSRHTKAERSVGHEDITLQLAITDLLSSEERDEGSGEAEHALKIFPHTR